MFMVYHGNLWESMENFRILLTVLDLFLDNSAIYALYVGQKKLKKIVNISKVIYLIKNFALQNWFCLVT